jgi:hypothetical protein
MRHHRPGHPIRPCPGIQYFSNPLYRLSTPPSISITYGIISLGIRNFATTARMTANQQLFPRHAWSMDIAGGTINASGQFDGSNPKKILLHSKINAEDVNIEKLLLKLDYLGQDYVINKNLHGSLSGQIETNMQVHPDLTPADGKHRGPHRPGDPQRRRWSISPPCTPCHPTLKIRT